MARSFSQVAGKSSFPRRYNSHQGDHMRISTVHKQSTTCTPLWVQYGCVDQRTETVFEGSGMYLRRGQEAHYDSSRRTLGDDAASPIEADRKRHAQRDPQATRTERKVADGPIPG